MRKAGGFEVIGQLELGELEGFAVDEIGLGHRDEPRPDVEELQDRDVFGGLRHPALVRGDDEERDLHRADAGEHVLHEAHVTGHVDEPDVGAGGQGREREAEVDREPARLLLREPVGIGARQREHERRLAVVDVPGGRNDADSAPPRLRERRAECRDESFVVDRIDRTEVAHDATVLDPRDDTLEPQPARDPLRAGRLHRDSDGWDLEAR